MTTSTGKAGTVTIFGIATDGTPRPLLIDTGTRVLPVMEYEHWTVHNNIHYFCSDKTELALNGVKNYVIVTPTHVAGAEFASAVHFHFEVTGSAITQFDFYEDTTRTIDDDNLIATFNSNRLSTNAAKTKIYGVAGAGDDGTLLITFKGGSSTQQSRVGETANSAQEIVLKKNAKYLLRITSGTAANFTDAYMLWYELDRFA